MSGKIKKEKDEYTCTKNLNYRPIQINNSDVYACLEPDNQLKCSSVNKMFHRNYFVDIFTISSESWNWHVSDEFQRRLLWLECSDS